MSTEGLPAPELVDLVVLGSGAAALAAAATAAGCGAHVLVLEKTELLGGTSALSGGEIWIPGSQAAREAGVEDSLEACETYLHALLGAALEPARVRAYLQAAPRALSWLESKTELRYALMPRSADYHSELPGACAGGRSLAVLPYEGRVLGEAFRRLRSPLRNALVFGGTSVCTRLDLPHLLAAGRRPASAWHAARLIARGWFDRLGGHPRGTRLTNGNALVGRLLATLLAKQVPLRTRVQVSRLLVEDGRVAGVAVASAEGGREGERLIRSRCGVVLATGGFSASADSRRRHFAHVERGAQHQALPPLGNTGDAFALAAPLGVEPRLQGMRPAAWTPVSLVPTPHGEPAPFPHFSDRGRPGIVAIGPDGRRFVNESLSYHEFVTALLARGFDHAWLVADHRALRRHGLGAVRPFPSPLGEHLRSGYLKRGRDWPALARAMGVPADVLRAAVEVFNRHAARGEDPEFQRGSSLFERRCGDADHGPNPALGPLEKPPFYALKVLPGDIGTFFGLPTDGAARVLDANGHPVPGLYAAGNAAQSLFAGHYPSAGITLGPALTFGWLAARHALGVEEEGAPPNPQQESGCHESRQEPCHEPPSQSERVA